MNRLLLAGMLGMGLVSVSFSSWGQAVSAMDTTRFEQRLQVLEQRFQGGASMAATAPRHAQTAAGAGNYGVNALDQRMGDIEQEMSSQTGGIERLGYAIEKLARKLDDVIKDNDLRMNEIEARLMKLEAGRVAVPALAPAAGGVVSTGVSATANTGQVAEKKN